MSNGVIIYLSLNNSTSIFINDGLNRTNDLRFEFHVELNDSSLGKFPASSLMICAVSHIHRKLTEYFIDVP